MKDKPTNGEVKPMKKAITPPAPAEALIKLEQLKPETINHIVGLLEKDILPNLQADVSNYAKGRMRVWLPYEAPLDSSQSFDRPFIPGLLHGELWQFIVNLCAKHGFTAQVALASKGGSIKPHRDTTYAAEWSFAINLGECNWGIASSRDLAKPNYLMELKGGEVFKFNCKHVHSVANVAPNRWAINVWAIANTNAARNANVNQRLQTMLDKNPQVAEFINKHKPTTNGEVKPMNNAITVSIPPPPTPTTGGNNMEPIITNNTKEVTSMFHGMIRTASTDNMRLATNMPLKDTDIVVEEYKGGVYSFAFLDTFFPTGYRLEVRSVMTKKVGHEGPLSTYDPDWYNDGQDQNVAIRWSNATHQYNLIIANNNAWLDSLMNDGKLIIGNSKKFIKRAQEFVRMTSAFMHTDELRVQIMDPKQIRVDEKAVDGISAISRSMAMQMFLNNPSASMDWMQDKVDQIEKGKMVIVQIRVLTPHGLIKGNAIITPDNQMHGYDIRTFTPNVKPEIKTNGYYWATIEPSYGRLPLKSDDLTMSIYKNVVGLVDPALLLATMQEVVNHTVADIKANAKSNSDWVQVLIDNTGAIEHSDEDIKNKPSMIKTIDQLSKRLHEAGLGINVSQLLMYFKANSFGLMFGVVNNLNKVVSLGEVFKATNNGTWFPIPYAYRAHIMTRDALSIFGYQLPKNNNQGFYHHKTHCFVVPTKFFIENYTNHGGFDLDDTINVMIRNFVDSDGKVTLKAFLLRNPNDFGEWSTIPVSDKEIKNAFHTYGKIPEVNEAMLNTIVPQLSDMIKNKMISYKFKELPGVASLKISDQYSIDDEERVRLSIEQLPGGTGATVLPKMLTYAITDMYIENQLVSNEQIIDAVQQGLANGSDMALIAQSNDEYYRNIKHWLVDNKGTIDYYWAQTRINPATAQRYGYTSKTFTHVLPKNESMMMELMLTRETIVRRAYAELMTWCNAEAVMPDAIAAIVFTPEELKAAPGEFNTIMELMRNTNPSKLWASKLVNMLKKSDELYGQEVTNRKVLKLYRQSFIAKRSNPRANWDKWLFAVDAEINQLPIDWFIRAYTSL